MYVAISGKLEGDKNNFETFLRMNQDSKLKVFEHPCHITMSGNPRCSPFILARDSFMTHKF